jgi:hypothetical protein
MEGSDGGRALATLASSWMANGYGVDGEPEQRRLTVADGVGPPAVAATVGLL